MTLPDIDAISSYNGAPSGILADYALAVQDPTTDVPAAGLTAMMASVAMATRMMPRAYCTFSTNGATCTLIEHEAVWGNSVSVQPTPARTSTGLFTVTWPASVADAT